MKLSVMAATLAASALLPTVAAASPTVVRDAVLFWAVDRNSDGAVDRSEADVLRGLVFDAIDTNLDGRVTQAEVGILLVPIKPDAKDKAIDKALRRREQMLARLNLNKPEGIPRDEFIGRNEVVFVEADANNDARIDPAEFVVLIGDLGELLPQ